MNNAVIYAAILTALATAVLAPIANRLLARLAESRARLRADVIIQEYNQPQCIMKVIQEKADALEWTDPERDKMRGLARLSGNLQLKLTNTSKRRINNITVLSNLPLSWYQLEGSEELHPLKENQKVDIGDLQPHHAYTLNCWSAVDLTVAHISRLKTGFMISADEIDRVYYRFPAPTYLAKMFTISPGWVRPAWIIFTLMVLWAIVTFVSYQIGYWFVR